MDLSAHAKYLFSLVLNFGVVAYVKCPEKKKLNYTIHTIYQKSNEIPCDVSNWPCLGHITWIMYDVLQWARPIVKDMACRAELSNLDKAVIVRCHLSGLPIRASRWVKLASIDCGLSGRWRNSTEIPNVWVTEYADQLRYQNPETQNCPKIGNSRCPPITGVSGSTIRSFWIVFKQSIRTDQ